MHSLPKSWRVVCLAAALLGCGCNRGQGMVAGKVTYQNRPLECGSVVLVGADGRPRTAALTAGGAYTLSNVPCGEARLAVHSPDPAEREKIYHEEQIKLQKGVRPPPERKPAAIDRTKWLPIPGHYGDFDKSGLTMTVQPGANRRDIDLK